MSQNIEFKSILSNMRWSWLLGMGCVTALACLGVWVPHSWMPIVGLLLIVPLLFYGNQNIIRGDAHCSRINHYVVYTLFFSSVIMLVINLINSRWFMGHEVFHPLRSHMPFISSLIVYPVATILLVIGLAVGPHTEYCNACREQAGNSLRASLVHNVQHAEAVYQLRLALVICALLSAVMITYYFVFYINVNINAPDTFFFFIIPFAVYVLSCIFIVGRYANMRFEISIASNRSAKDSRTALRYIVVKGDCILLEQVVRDKSGLALWDTPAFTDIPYTNEMSRDEADAFFRTISGTDHYSVRELFVTSLMHTNTFHYAAFLPDDAETPGLQGNWFSLYEIEVMLKTGMIARPFAYEINRIFTITMAWKTYDRHGRRLYPVKNYRPTFRISDFKDWTVDYNDLTWMSVAKNNEDQPLYKVRRFWRKYISGKDTRWRRRRS